MGFVSKEGLFDIRRHFAYPKINVDLLWGRLSGNLDNENICPRWKITGNSLLGTGKQGLIFELNKGEFTFRRRRDSSDEDYVATMYPAEHCVYGPSEINVALIEFVNILSSKLKEVEADELKSTSYTREHTFS